MKSGGKHVMRSAHLEAEAAAGGIFPLQALRQLRPIGPGVRNPLKGAHTSIAKANRWTGKPHEHRREIARRLRQGGVQ